ncbi:uncharacterized AIM2 family protein C30D10.14 [Folsomia candida]|uniref:uncharacterized AIM2 family protein C30D10.14 n=1 Tax=Folsomia candida TaxID=158441 RepID=UPI000B907194|nr:uncharacterized AIM2 family protein C30D10.14 [Folsomia candida]
MFPHNLLNTFIFIMFLKFYENSSALIVSPNFENSNGILTSLPTLNNGELTIYQSCPRGNNVSSGRPILLLIYDIFGLHPHAFHYADRVANLTGYCVLVPDFFRLKPFPTKGYPPRNPNLVTKFIQRNGSFEHVVKPDIISVVDHYDADKWGAFGFCWGGKMVPLLLGDATLGQHFLASVSIHPAPVKFADVAKMSKPQKLMLLPSKDEANLVPLCTYLNRRLGRDTCETKRYTDMPHGFGGALGNWKNPRIMKNVNDSIVRISSFFNEVFN